ncbi:D-alanyl-D-alanine carboxypeptidase [Paenibacillus sp. J5C_2022]|uniref:D-alanyl-D-alanine carboxypeptidase family protein n=1 Tax=Paenibacillus sp. J5C2022 TaxID=2977129 RepID=UPI0021D13A74|nr:D-alanyl-D-alanine carboxypeptidase family protein [Paenibacillus sp. J5C2022]MCU6712974.1 D-alanyl-D-alanine carboxypeptidase [Paenibacillus sp. J5C2022]
MRLRPKTGLKEVVSYVTIVNGQYNGSGEINVNARRKKKSLLSVIAASMALWVAVLSIGAPSALAVGFNDRPSTDNELGLQVKSAILIEADSGQVLYEVLADEPLPIASMTKLMTEYIVLKEIKSGQLQWDQVVTITKEAADTDPAESQVFLAEGDKHTVRELYIAMAVGSANDATKALAIAVAGSLEAFTDMMNETADELGLESAIFTSVTGLEDTTVMSAYDVAMLGRAILRDYPEFLEFSGIQEYKFRERDKKPMVNFNYMLGANVNNEYLQKLAYEGVDGMKTGFINAAGYNFAGTVKRGDLRFISVVMDTSSKNQRFYETATLYNYGFNNFEKKTVVSPKTVVETLETVEVKKGVNKTVPVVTDHDITIMVKKGANPKMEMTSSSVTPKEELVAPIPAGTKVGTVTYTYADEATGNDLQYTVNLVTTEEVEKASWLKLFFRAIGEFFSKLFDSIINLF